MIFIVFQVDELGMTTWPFGVNWGGHFPWSNSIFHDTPNPYILQLNWR